MKSSIDWMAEQLHENAIKALVKREINLAQFTQKRDEILNTAREMHRKEIEEAYEAGEREGYDSASDNEFYCMRPDEYYTETFQQPTTNQNG